jgi:hypothetical protein
MLSALSQSQMTLMMRHMKNRLVRLHLSIMKRVVLMDQLHGPEQNHRQHDSITENYDGHISSLRYG